MCEPNHSIIQYPDQDPSGKPTGSLIDAIADRIWKPIKTKIKDWFHLSKFGYGHSEAVGVLSPTARIILPQDTKYEAAWWDRTVSVDGSFNGPDYDKIAAYEAAKEYAHRVSIGNLTLFRQFLEVSMRKSDTPSMYFYKFPSILNRKGKDCFQQQIKRLGLYHCDITANLDKSIRFLLGLTRKRGLLVPEWADDPRLWGAT